jgi:hypothetical protein
VTQKPDADFSDLARAPQFEDFLPHALHLLARLTGPASNSVGLGLSSK